MKEDGKEIDFQWLWTGREGDVITRRSDPTAGRDPRDGDGDGDDIDLIFVV